MMCGAPINKGEFKTGDGIYCYPLTVTDGATRFLIECKGLDSTNHVQAKAVFKDVFRTTTRSAD